MIKNRYACYLSIDLEDYKHATMLDMGLRPLANPEQTWRGVDRILSVLRASGSHANLTLFTTGQIARDQPDLVMAMSRLGHEIACHGDQHENVFTLDRTGFLNNVRRAKASLEDACGQQVVGFRAPNFSIDKRSPWAYTTLAEAGFIYDSSLATSAARTNTDAYDVLGFSSYRLYEFPIYRRTITDTHGIRVIGGTYFRLLPLSVILTLMKKAIDLGYVPLIYLHAADADDRPSPVGWREMSGLSPLSRSRWVVRQAQWSLGAKTVPDKLLEVLKIFPHLGPMRNALPRQETR